MDHRTPWPIGVLQIVNNMFAIDRLSPHRLFLLHRWSSMAKKDVVVQCWLVYRISVLGRVNHFLFYFLTRTTLNRGFKGRWINNLTVAVLRWFLNTFSQPSPPSLFLWGYRRSLIIRASSRCFHCRLLIIIDLCVVPSCPCCYYSSACLLSSARKWTCISFTLTHKNRLFVPCGFG